MYMYNTEFNPVLLEESNGLFSDNFSKYGDLSVWKGILSQMVHFVQFV